MFVSRGIARAVSRGMVFFFTRILLWGKYLLGILIRGNETSGGRIELFDLSYWQILNVPTTVSTDRLKLIHVIPTCLLRFPVTTRPAEIDLPLAA